MSGENEKAEQLPFESAPDWLQEYMNKEAEYFICRLRVLEATDMLKRAFSEMAQFAWNMNQEIPRENQTQEEPWIKMSYAHRHYYWCVAEWEDEYKHPSMTTAPNTSFRSKNSPYYDAYQTLLLKRMGETGVQGPDKP